MPKISLVINADTRNQKDEQGGLFAGAVNLDFITDGIFQKKKALTGFDIETILFIDQHNPLPGDVLKYIYSECETVCIRKHTNENSFNDYNYLAALSLCRGDYIMHFDQDTNIFVNSSDYINELINLLDTYKFVSYPSYWTPRAVHDPSFGNRTWASTRFFICKRETLKFDVLRNCIEEPEWAYQTFGDSPRRCNWLEHFLALSNNDSCYYPPIEPDKGVIFTWGRYEQYVLRRLNESSYEDITNFINSKGGIVYPVDVHV